jgi:5'-3' exoribonuclease 2
LPSLEIREGAIDRLVGLYKSMLPQLGGYLTDSGIVNLQRAEIILSGIGQVEDEIFKKRQANEIEFKRRQKEKNNRSRWNSDNMPAQMPAWMKSGPYACVTPLMGIKAQQEVVVDVESTQGPDGTTGKGVKRKTDRDEKSEQEDKKLKDTHGDEVVEEIEGDSDPVRLWEDGWRQRYYKVKFDVNENDTNFRYNVARHYAIGLSWVLRYYYQGVPAWNWYFPYHYAPFASDFKNIGDVEVKFDSSVEPFRPFEQLMAVFPAASRQHIPGAFQSLMYNPESEIIDFYPEDFCIDLNGKKQSWQGVALLPFVDEVRLKKALTPHYHKLNEEEVKRNIRGSDCLFVSQTSVLYNFLREIYLNENMKQELKIMLETTLSGGIAGHVWIDENVNVNTTFFKSPIRYLCPDLKDNKALSVKYKDPEYESTHVFKSCLLKGAKLPEPTLKPSDYHQGQNYRPHLGFNRDDGYRPNKDASVANRMLQNTVQSAQYHNQYPPPMSSAYGGQNSLYGTYNTNSYRNNNQQQYNNNNNNYNSNYNGNYNRGGYSNNNYNQGSNRYPSNNSNGGTGRPSYQNNNYGNNNRGGRYSNRNHNNNNYPNS